MKSNLALLVILSVLLALLTAGTALAGPAGKVDVCHAVGDGSYIKINISENAFPAHVEHGDASPGEMVPGLSGKKFDADCNVVDAGPVVTPGAPTWTRAAGVRYKGYNTGSEIFLGPMTSTSATPRVEANYNEFQTVGQKTYQVTFGFDQLNNAIATSISSPDAALLFDFDSQGAPGCAAADWDAMQIFIGDNRTDSGVALQNVLLGSFSLGNFGAVDRLGTPGGQDWTVTGYDFSQGFQLTADLVVDGFNGNEAIKVQFNVGCLP